MRDRIEALKSPSPDSSRPEIHPIERSKPVHEYTETPVDMDGLIVRDGLWGAGHVRNGVSYWVVGLILSRDGVEEHTEALLKLPASADCPWSDRPASNYGAVKVGNLTRVTPGAWAFMPDGGICSVPYTIASIDYSEPSTKKAVSK
jgi:hypothetical protein